MGEDPVVSYAGGDAARRRWREMLDAVEHKGEHVIVQRYGRPSVAVVPIDWYTQAQWALEAKGEKGKP